MVVERNILDFAVKNTVTSDSLKKTDIGFKDGLIEYTGNTIDCENCIDAKGLMTIPGFVNIHTHLDKADLLSKIAQADYGKSLEENRELLRKYKKNYAVDEILDRAEQVVKEMVQNGITAIRSHVDIDATVGLKCLKALLELREQLENNVTLQLCAFPQEGVLKKGVEDLLNDALENEADLLGGLPLVEKDQEGQLQHLDILFDIAKKHDCDLDIQIDESNNPQDFMLPILAEKTIENKWIGRVSATHCISLSAVDDKIAEETIKLVKDAKINVIVTPSANLMTGFNLPEDIHSRASNSITRVKELIEQGVNVAMGTDNIRDIFYPLGNCSMLREMHVLAASTRMTGINAPQKLFDIATINGAKIMGLDYGLSEGCVADLNVLNRKTLLETLNSHPHIPYVIKNGGLIVKNHLDSRIMGDMSG